MLSSRRLSSALTFAASGVFLQAQPELLLPALLPCHQVLALELLKILLENSGVQFRTAERFVSAIKQYLCLSLLKNCQSAVPAALRLCCSIFLTLMSKFRKNLKAEIGGLAAYCCCGRWLCLKTGCCSASSCTGHKAGRACPSTALLISSSPCLHPGRRVLPHDPAAPHRAASDGCHAQCSRCAAFGGLSQGSWIASRPQCRLLGCFIHAHHTVETGAEHTPHASLPAGTGGAPSAPVDIAHKAVVLRCLQAQCEDGQLLVDLFVNYDCDLEVRPPGSLAWGHAPAAWLNQGGAASRTVGCSPSCNPSCRCCCPALSLSQGANLFERTVTALVRIAQGSLAHEPGATQTPLEEQAIRYEVSFAWWEVGPGCSCKKNCCVGLALLGYPSPLACEPV